MSSNGRPLPRGNGPRSCAAILMPVPTRLVIANIPGTGEFIYSTESISRGAGGNTASENVHSLGPELTLVWIGMNDRHEPFREFHFTASNANSLRAADIRNFTTEGLLVRTGYGTNFAAWQKPQMKILSGECSSEPFSNSERWGRPMNA